MTLVEAHDRVEARVAELMGTINLATAELVGVIADVVENETWATAAGIKSPEHWVTWQCGVSSARAIALVNTARRLKELPRTAAVFGAGQLSEESMAAIARRAPGARDEEIAEHVARMLHSQIDRLLRTMPKAESEQPDTGERESSVSFGVDGERWKLRADLSLDEGALVEKALTAGRSQVFYERHPDATSETRSDVNWVDGLVRAADLALRGLGNGNGRPADRHQVLLHIDVTDKTAMLHLGSIVPDPIRRYLACDADVRALIEGNGILAAMSSRMRTVDDRMRAFIEQRDGGCRVPGCEQKRWLHIHHLLHWEDGGPTESCNLCALCPVHHRLHHLGLLEIRGSPDTIDGLRFFDQYGREIVGLPKVVSERPVLPPPQPYVHPPGAPINWYWFNWRELERDRDLN